MMNKAKKGLTILIEETIIENEEESHLAKLISAVNKMKIEESPTWVTEIHQRYQDELIKLSSINNAHLTQLMNYMEGVGWDMAKIYLPFTLKDRNIDLYALNKCIFLSPKRNKSTAKRNFSLEYNVLKLLTDNILNQSRLISLGKSLKNNNRYADLIPYESNFVPYSHLDTYNILNQSEWYINASSIDGPLREDQKMFIATQGPLLNTIGKFYQMCFTHEVKLIIMLNWFEEEGRKKCERYYPQTIGEQCIYNYGNNDGKVEVTLQNEEWLILNCLIKRRLLIHINNEYKSIEHIQMFNWPDHCAPDINTGFDTINKLIRIIIDYREDFELSPVIVHCSAGVGRTGTFIALFNLIKCLLVYKSIDYKEIYSKPKAFLCVFNVVKMIREQRIGMVTSLEQYKFIYEFVFEWFDRYVDVNV